jgi:hypothetical protein
MPLLILFRHRTVAVTLSGQTAAGKQNAAVIDNYIVDGVNQAVDVCLLADI